MKNLSTAIEETKPSQQEPIFKIERLSFQGSDGQIFTHTYHGGVHLSTDKFRDGDQVVTVKDNQGKVHILGEGFK